MGFDRIGKVLPVGNFPFVSRGMQVHADMLTIHDRSPQNPWAFQGIGAWF